MHSLISDHRTATFSVHFPTIWHVESPPFIATQPVIYWVETADSGVGLCCLQHEPPSLSAWCYEGQPVVSTAAGPAWLTGFPASTNWCDALSVTNCFLSWDMIKLKINFNSKSAEIKNWSVNSSDPFFSYFKLCLLETQMGFSHCWTKPSCTQLTWLRISQSKFLELCWKYPHYVWIGHGSMKWLSV